MTISFKQVKKLLRSDENEHLEFKEAKERFDFEKLVKYCVALANEGGGKFILGVSDKKPRKIVGTKAFKNLESTKAKIIERLHLRVEVEEIFCEGQRTLILSIPSRPLGIAIQYKGAYWMRGGEELVPMTPDKLKRIFAEAEPDYSAEICQKASIKDLDPRAIERFRQMWIRRSGNSHLENISYKQLLSDAELIIDGGITYAALILLATRKALGRYLAQAEIIFEYRSSEASTNYQQRKELREGFFLYQDELWETIDLRNELYHYQDGLFMREIPTFNEVVVREAILNAVSHREYRLAGSIFIRQFPKKLEVISPGGFPPGITPENILWKQYPRNRRIAEVFSKCGLIERSGQGADRMFEYCIKESKPQPDYSLSDEYQVYLILRGEVQDPRFLIFLEKIGKERLATFTTSDLIVLDLIHKEKPVPENLRERLFKLREYGVIESVGHGKGTRYLLSRRFYHFLGEKGTYTRKKGLDWDTNKALLLKHIKENKKTGSKLSELREVLPVLSRNQIQGLLREMKEEKLIFCVGRTKGARWYPFEKSK